MTVHKICKGWGMHIWIIVIVSIIIVSMTAHGEQSIRIETASYVPDRKFPTLLPFIWDGWDLKFGTFNPKPYESIVTVGATIHMTVHNQSSDTVSVNRLFLNTIDLTKHILTIHREHEGLNAANYILNKPEITPEEIRTRLDNLGAPIWYMTRPNPIPANGFAEIIIRLRRLPNEENLTITIDADDSELVSTTLPSSKPQTLRLASVNFNNTIDRAYIYVRHTEGKDFIIKSVRLDGTSLDISSSGTLASSRGFIPLPVSLPSRWTHGSFHHIAVATTDGDTAASVIRARDDFFALGMWGYRNYGNTDAERARDTIETLSKHLFNTHMGMGHNGYLRSEEGLRLLKVYHFRLQPRDPTEATNRSGIIYSRFLLDEPDAHDYAVQDLPGNLRVGSLAQGIVQRQESWTLDDPRNLCLLNVDLTYKPENWIIYGQIPDILAADPYYQNRLGDTYQRHPGWIGQFYQPLYVFAISEIIRWACEPKPSHVILNSVSMRDMKDVFRYGTPEEKRVEFYYALAAGARGISYWWFTPYGECYGCGSEEPAAKAMMREMARLNVEARSVLPLLATACPAAGAGVTVDPFAVPVPPWLTPRTLFAGEDTALLILINRDHASDRTETIYEPLEKARIHFTPPGWLSVKDIFLLTSDGISQPETKKEEGEIIVYLNNFQLTGMLIFTADTILRQDIERRWQSMQPALQAVLKTSQ